MSFFDLTAKTLDGKPQPLSAYRGQVVLVVNTASECGFTPQYDGLEKLHEEYKGKGFTVLGFQAHVFFVIHECQFGDIKHLLPLRIHWTLGIGAE